MRIPPSFYNAIGRFLLFMALEAICILLVVRNGIVQQYTVTDKLRSVQTFFWNTETNIQNYTKLREINADIVEQNSALMAENARLRSCINEIKGNLLTDSLERELQRDPAFTYDYAKVIKNRFNGSNNFIIINKGSNHGIKEDMGVITPTGVVGIVRAVGKKSAYILSSLNNKQHISAKLGKSNTIGTLSWNGNGLLDATLNDIPQHIPVEPGDTVYTSGYSSFFPADIPLGIAVSSKVVNGMHRSVKVKLLQDFSILDNVIIVKNNNFNEIESLSGFNE